VEFTDSNNDRCKCIIETSAIFGTSRLREEVIEKSAESISNDQDLKALVDFHKQTEGPG
jgi:hypothetical protein